MRAVDAMPKPMRELVHEFGFSIVYSMREDGYRSAAALRPVLERWRARRQQEMFDAPVHRRMPG